MYLLLRCLTFENLPWYGGFKNGLGLTKIKIQLNNIKSQCLIINYKAPMEIFQPELHCLT